MDILNVELPDKIIDKLDKKVRNSTEKKNEYVKEALELYLNEKSYIKRRHAKYLIILTLIPFIFLSGFLLISKQYSHITLFFLVLAILISVVVMFHISIKEIYNISIYVKRMCGNTKDSVKNILTTNLKNSRIPLYSKEDVRQEAKKLYNEVAQATEKTEKKIYYFGAASIYPTQEEYDELKEKADTEESITIEEHPVVLIMKAFDRITVPDSNVVIERYVKLPNESELKCRSIEYLKNLSSWLDRQVKLIEKCDSYTFYTSTRAFEYNSLLSSIAGPSGVLEIIGNGNGGAVIRSEAERKNYVKLMKQYMNEAKEENQPKPYNQNNTDQLKNKIKEINSIIEHQG